MTVKGGTTPACAACKYQRRKCSPNCPLAPYFPANQTRMFRSVHRLFGVSNVTKTLEKLNTKDQKEDAMRSIIYEAEMRERFPVEGCCAIISQLQQRLHSACQEMHIVRANLEVCRDMNNKAVVDGWIESSPPLPLEQPLGQYFLTENGEESVVKPMLLTLESDNTMMSSNLSMVQAQIDDFCIEERNSNDFETHRFINSGIFDDRRCYNETKIEDDTEAFELSPESSLDNPLHAAEHGCRNGGAAENSCRWDLTTAAADFTLTTVN